ncbi:peptide/nickel transport system substrate-binding protein [Microvirga flocculans]|uniref:Peptide/nickel transport system substrate-binding protein n=1 Tax=Microvirga flocculans TaxID=217168 RepID=A0A7W6IFT6_9HYPH|nr:ABC transporter substrate-binding protein [Microvirga flocculans]MBB4040701.1 peptide/nickel transport system substrate-binding protein [Microvirga flocculans]
MVRSALRSALGAGFLMAAMASASAQVLEIGADASPTGLDPHLITAFPSFMVVNGNIYEGLTAIDKDLKIVPALAESWTVSADGKTYTFKLRANVKFHDGSAMEAEDVVASIKRVQSKDIASPLASRLSAVESASAVDPQTVELKLKEPSAALLSSLATIAIVPSAMEANKDALQKAPVGTGPFKFQEWQPNGFILLTKNEAYWDKGLPKLSGLKFNIVPESATRQVGLSNGQYALLPNIDAATALQLKGKPNVKLAETMDLAYMLIGMNVSKPPFDNPKVREAVNYAINRQEIVDAALFGAGVPGGPLSPALKSWALDVKQFACYKPDPAKAQALLKEAGVATPVAVTLKVLPRQDVKDIAQVVQEQLNKAGFKVELVNQEQGQFIQDWRNSNFDMFASINAGQPDPDEYFYRTFRTGGSTNVFKYSDAELDGLLDQARTLQDQAARKAAYDKVQQKLACSGPVAHLTYGTLFSAMNSKLQGYDVMPNRSLMLLRNASY